VRRDLERIEIPGEHEARERTWAVLDAAFAERQPAQRPVRRLRPVLVIAVALAAVAAALSPPGRAVLDEIREVVGVERAQPALFSLPTQGRLLVVSDPGAWVVQADGSRRLLGPYREATWSPSALFVAATRENELAAVEPDGDVRWTLARRQVHFPRWTGSATDTRIVYLTPSRLRVVPGDGTGDAAGPRAATTVPPAWRPGARFVVAYVDTRGRVWAFDVDARRTFWPPRLSLSPRFADARKLEWSSDGSRLLLVTPSQLVVFGMQAAAPLAVLPMRDVVDAAFEPGTHRIAVARGGEIALFDADRPTAKPRLLFAGTGPFDSLAWSPDGRWLVVGWSAADQWVFVRGDGRRIRAVSNVSEQFRSRSFPRIEGWCCAR